MVVMDIWNPSSGLGGTRGESSSMGSVSDPHAAARTKQARRELRNNVMNSLGNILGDAIASVEWLSE
jgi:hypothetical protein